MPLSHHCLTEDQAALLTMKFPYKTFAAARVLSIPIFFPSGRSFKILVITAEKEAEMEGGCPAGCGAELAFLGRQHTNTEVMVGSESRR